MDDQKKFSLKILELGELFDKSLSDATVKLYWRSLNDFSDEQVQAALDRSLMTSKFMPKPVEIRELIDGDSKSQSVGEWGKILKLMRKQGRFGEKYLPDHVLSSVNQLGGWEYLCTLTYRDLEFKQKDFGKVFETKIEQGVIGHDQRRISND